MPASARRLPTGGIIDRSKSIGFRFNGKSYSGFAGDTLASALIANGVSLTARSFKYHRPRGIVGAGHEEPGSLVELVGDEQSANQPITTVRLRDGLDARSVNCWPSPHFDLMGINQLFSRFIPAAFYYKTFMWPNWHLFEPHIRRAAGLASAPDALLHQGLYETRHGHCDILVVGAGPAGLTAALAAARAGARVMLVDDQMQAGGSLSGLAENLDGRHALQWVDDVVAELDALANVVRLRSATAWAYREHNLIMVTERAPDEDHVFQRTWRVRARQVIIATGAIERAMVFADNDRPGIMMASAAQIYVNRYAVAPGQRAVVFTNNNSAYRVAAEMKAAGIEVAAIIDSRTDIDDAARSLAAGIEICQGQVVSRSEGRRRVKAAVIRSAAGGSERRIACDLLVMSGGWNPAVHLFSQSRGSLRYDTGIEAFVPDRAVQACLCAGSASGLFTLSGAIEDGAEKARLALRACGLDSPNAKLPTTVSELPYTIEALWHVEQDNPAAKSFVDIQNDVTLNDVHLAMREGFGAVEHVKRYTTAGMGIDQGKTGNINVIGAIANRAGQDLQDIGTTTFRSPYVPIEFGAIGGQREGPVVLPYRHTPITDWHRQAGAEMYEAGARWRRPGYYPLKGESFQQTVDRESLAVREGVGVYDGAPLGKFEIKGPDAGKFLDLLYTNVFSTLKTGMGRYGLMLTDDGIILDDGVSFKLGDNHFLMSTSTGHADEVNRHMEHVLQIERPQWQVMITTVTTQWANATVCGPKARQLVEKLCTDIDLSAEAFPFMAMREGTVAGIAARICRVSFTGELSFEINVAARHFAKLWDKIMEAGGPMGIVPVGSEANHVLRVEKGFLSLGHEADGTTDAYDLGMGWIMSKKKPDYIGKRSVEIRRAKDRPRRELVGLLIDDPARLVTEGAPVTPEGRRQASEGLVTACVHSVALKRSVALALLEDGRARIGQKAHIRMKDDVVSAEITAPCFYDPDGERLRS
ncbi:MAG: sarcosine oxidase subunit alpha family protein [Alphaproteobacteria bacterium]|nr:sarcosine oxidase subunit alpha family protein [Alphaproteobacteria bacterium]